MSETGASSGLTSAEAARRLAQYGPNEPVRVRRLSALHQLVRLFATPLVAILLVAAIISATLGQGTDAVIIITIVVLGVGLNFWQTYRSGVAAEKLKASVMPTATVRRDGTWRELPMRVVVPGDVFRLSAGDLIPADGRLVESRDLSVGGALRAGMASDLVATPVNPLRDINGLKRIDFVHEERRNLPETLTPAKDALSTGSVNSFRIDPAGNSREGCSSWIDEARLLWQMQDFQCEREGSSRRRKRRGTG